jgi:hypothetical protein
LSLYSNPGYFQRKNLKHLKLKKQNKTVFIFYNCGKLPEVNKLWRRKWLFYFIVSACVVAFTLWWYTVRVPYTTTEEECSFQSDQETKREKEAGSPNIPLKSISSMAKLPSPISAFQSFHHLSKAPQANKKTFQEMSLWELLSGN